MQVCFSSVHVKNLLLIGLWLIYVLLTLLGVRNQWTAPMGRGILSLSLANEHSTREYITSIVDWKWMIGCPLLVGAVHWLCPPISVGMVLVQRCGVGLIHGLSNCFQRKKIFTISNLQPTILFQGICVGCIRVHSYAIILSRPLWSCIHG